MKTGEAEEVDVIESEQDAELDEDLPQGEESEEEGEASEGAEEGADAGQEDEETVVSIGSEEAPASEDESAAPEWVRDVRRENREKGKRIKELEAQLAVVGKPTQQAQLPKLPDKPSLAGCDYDEEKFTAAMDEWHAKKRELDDQRRAQEASQRAAAEAQQKATQAVQERYAASKAALKVKDYQEAEEEVVSHFSDWQQGIAAKTKQPAAVVYALGKNPKKLQELASIKDPVEFAFAMGVLQTEVKVMTKRTSGNKPAPEKTVGGGSGGSTSKATLERLYAEAEKTGDRSKVSAYLRQQRTTGKK